MDLSKTCFIVLPGFSPDNLPVVKIKNALEAKGFNTAISSFFGDCQIDDFASISIDECKNNLAKLVEDCAKKYQRVVGIGVSFGGALFLDHAKTKNNLEGIVSIGTPFQLKYRRLIGAGQLVLPLVYPLWKKLERKKNWRLPPIGAAAMIIKFLENDFLTGLEKITAPVLFLHSQQDPVTDYRALKEFTGKISSPRKEVIVTENGNHVIDYNTDLIIEHLMKLLADVD